MVMFIFYGDFCDREMIKRGVIFLLKINRYYENERLICCLYFCLAFFSCYRNFLDCFLRRDLDFVRFVFIFFICES